MQVVEVLAMDQEVEHVVTLAAHLQTGFHPVKRCGLEEFRRLERAEQVSEKKSGLGKCKSGYGQVALLGNGKHNFTSSFGVSDVGA